METPRLLLVPEFTELEWTIRPRLAEWAEVASYDPPGVGSEPIHDVELDELRRGERSIRALFVRRGLEEIDRRGWHRCFLVADGYGTATAARIALERPEAVQGIALGHASLSYDMDGERAPVSREAWAAMQQLLRHDHREFIRHGIVQITRGSVDDETAKQMVERFPDSEFIGRAWEALEAEHEPIGDMLRKVGCRLLLAQHQECISFREEGFEDAVDAFPDARVARIPGAPATREEFASAVRDFCEEVAAAGVAQGRTGASNPGRPTD
jgi:pimeloyl-ACP methyl ester carboxylesterase